MGRRLIAIVVLFVAVATAIAAWTYHASVVNNWLAVHTGTVNEAGPYYAFWSGFGSDLTEFGIIGALGTGVYQLTRKYNCHENSCWRIGNHPAAGGQFQLCYRHHPDYQDARPTRDTIARLHREHRQREALIAQRLPRIHLRPATGNTAAAHTPRLGKKQTEGRYQPHP